MKTEKRDVDTSVTIFEITSPDVMALKNNIPQTARTTAQKERITMTSITVFCHLNPLGRV